MVVVLVVVVVVAVVALVEVVAEAEAVAVAAMTAALLSVLLECCRVTPAEETDTVLVVRPIEVLALPAADADEELP